MKTALIDGDIIAYRAATSVGDLDYLLYKQINTTLINIQATLETDNIKIFLSGKDKPNFRRTINPDYKANRDHLEKPHWLSLCNLYLQEAWGADVVHGVEADDALGWYQNSNTIICSIDKDLDMIPGEHYNWIKNKQYYIQSGEALQFFYKQMLIGDTADNIKGIDKIGPVKASKLIDLLEEEQEMFDVVYNKYNNPKRFVMNACCLWIQQQKGITWAHLKQSLTLPDQCVQEREVLLNFMKSSQIDT